MELKPFFLFRVDLSILGKTKGPFYEISRLSVNVSNAMPAVNTHTNLLCKKHGKEFAWKLLRMLLNITCFIILSKKLVTRTQFSRKKMGS